MEFSAIAVSLHVSLSYVRNCAESHKVFLLYHLIARGRRGGFTVSSKGLIIGLQSLPCPPSSLQFIVGHTWLDGWPHAERKEWTEYFKFLCLRVVKVTYCSSCLSFLFNNFVLPYKGDFDKRILCPQLNHLPWSTIRVSFSLFYLKMVAFKKLLSWFSLLFYLLHENLLQCS